MKKLFLTVCIIILLSYQNIHAFPNYSELSKFMIDRGYRKELVVNGYQEFRKKNQKLSIFIIHKQNYVVNGFVFSDLSLNAYDENRALYLLFAGIQNTVNMLHPEQEKYYNMKNYNEYVDSIQNRIYDELESSNYKKTFGSFDFSPYIGVEWRVGKDYITTRLKLN